MFHWLLIYLQFVVIEDTNLFAGLGCQMSLCGSFRSILLASVKVGQSVRLAALLLKRLFEINTDV